ncbi:stxK domain protein [Lactobacillus psittaci DSM 15354]|uniref:StxK domain protein n=2 Tax=Lactobacillus psittaci TaxID=116089 RepID=A0A0R1RXM3_9LACO|nr:stxK domain protein [Lactobacillus psittaci DSM 15354]
MLIQLALSLYMTYSQLKAQRQKQESKNLSQQIHVMSLYTDELEANYQQLRKFKHDYNNLLLGLNLEDGQINKKYLQQVNKYSSEDLSKGYSIFKDLGNLKLKAVKSLILTKLIEARKAKIDVYFDARHPINDVNLEEIILVRMLGILLDNAIEAISEAQEKKLIIAMKEYDNTLKVVIENSFNGKEINPDKIRKYGYTTKKGSHGLGLANIMDIIKEHPNVHLKQEVVDKHFISTLEIN